MAILFDLLGYSIVCGIRIHLKLAEMVKKKNNVCHI